VAIGDFNADGFGDLAAGVPGENSTTTDTGAVNVIYGSASGLTSNGNQQWGQGSPDIEEKAEKYDDFGFTVVADEFGHGVGDDLVAAVIGEGVSNQSDAGGVNVIYGAPAGLSSEDDQFWSQGSPDIEDSPEAGDLFGWGLGSAPGSGALSATD
jgi:hypothetical protein